MLKELCVAKVPANTAGELPVKMAMSDATGERLVKDGPFGADLIRFPPGGRVNDHTHPGAHILYVTSGHGYVDYNGVPHELRPGTIYLIPSGERHGIRAVTELTILSVASDHRDVGDTERLTLVGG